jgi:hypothetical protein
MHFIRRAVDACDRSFTWLASWLPPPTPIGVRLFGYRVTWLDLFLVAGCIAITTGAVLWYGAWHWGILAVLFFILAWMMVEWMF